MADDIDELLDEVESKYIDSENRLSISSVGVTISSHEKVCDSGAEGGVEELESAINSICSIPEPIGVSSVNPSAFQIAKDSSRKCRVLYVGGSQSGTGVSSSSAITRKTPQRRPKPGTKICTKRYYAKPVFELSLKDLEAESARRKQKELVEILFEKKMAVVTNKIILDVRKYKRIKSDVWDNFGDVRLLISEAEAKKYNIDHHIIHLGEDEMILCKSFVACVKCSAVFSYESHSYGTSTLRAHLKSCGKPRYNMKEKKYQMLRLKRSMVEVGALASSKSASDILQPYHDPKPVFQEHMMKFRDRASKLQDQALLFFLSGSKSLKIVENKEFKNMLQTFVQIGANSGDIDVKNFIPDPSDLSDTLLQEAYLLSEASVRSEMDLLYGIGLSAEIWMDVSSKTSYISISCHYANESGVFKSVIIFTSEFPYEQKSYTELTFLYSECLRFMGLDNHRKLFIVDYSFNMVTAVEKDYLFIQCICYSVSRAVQSVINHLSWIENDEDPFALPSFASLLNQCRNLVMHFKENKLQSSLPKFLVMCSSTCWKSTLEMLQSINNQWDHIMDILQERDEHTLFNFDQELLSLVVDFLELYKDGCDELASISSPTLNIVIPWLTKWKRHCDQNPDESPFLASLKSHMSSAIDEEVVARITIYHKLAAMLDPRFKDLHFLSPEDQAEAREHAVVMVTECKDYITTEKSAAEDMILSTPTDHFADLYTITENDREFLSPPEEVESYLVENFVMGQQDLDSENKFNPLKYWTRNRERYPYLSRVALWILSCPASAVRERESLTHNWIVVFKESEVSSKHIHATKLVKSFRSM